MGKSSDSKTKITIVGLGYSDSEQSKKMRGFFKPANKYSMDQLKAALEKKHRKKSTGKESTGKEKRRLMDDDPHRRESKQWQVPVRSAIRARTRIQAGADCRDAEYDMSAK